METTNHSFIQARNYLRGSNRNLFTVLESTDEAVILQNTTTDDVIIATRIYVPRVGRDYMFSLA